MRLIDADAMKSRLDYCTTKGMGSTIAFMVKHMLDEQPTITPEPHWIPVTERLPKKHGAYIVCYSDFRHGIYYGRVIAVAWFDLGDTWLKYRYANNARTSPPKLHYVIAWMPLPEPYKGVTE